MLGFTMLNDPICTYVIRLIDFPDDSLIGLIDRITVIYQIDYVLIRRRQKRYRLTFVDKVSATIACTMGEQSKE